MSVRSFLRALFKNESEKPTPVDLPPCCLLCGCILEYSNSLLTNPDCTKHYDKVAAERSWEVGENLTFVGPRAVVIQIQRLFSSNPHDALRYLLSRNDVEIFRGTSSTQIMYKWGTKLLTEQEADKLRSFESSKG